MNFRKCAQDHNIPTFAHQMQRIGRIVQKFEICFVQNGDDSIWHSLNEPKNLRCISIGIAAGTGGSGKVALAKFLRRALRESLDYDGTWDQPFGSIDEFHKAAMSYFDSDFAHYERTIQKYADILNGEPGRHYVHTAKLIIGPWTRSPENLNATRECR